MSAIHTILMGDVEGSSNLEPEFVQNSLFKMIKEINSTYKSSIISPLTITLGDEFQGIVADNNAGTHLIFEMEHYRIEHKLPYRLHYVLYEGTIDTEINTETAYGMLGSGLTNARTLLSSKKRDRKRFEIKLIDYFTTTQVQRLFSVLDGLSETWKVQDFPLIMDMLRESNNQWVADKHQKTRAQIWKRRKTLQIEHYRTIQNTIKDLTNFKA